MLDLQSDAHLVSTLFRYHKKASPSAKLSSLYLIDALARAAKSKAKRDLAAPPKPKPQSTTPPNSPPPSTAASASGSSSGGGTAASFLAKLEAVLGRVVVDNWEDGLKEHRDKVRKVMGIWRQAGTFGEAVLARVEGKLVEEGPEGEGAGEEDMFARLGRGGGDDSMRVSPPPPPGGLSGKSLIISGRVPWGGIGLRMQVRVRGRGAGQARGGERPSALPVVPLRPTTIQCRHAAVLTDRS